MQRETSEIIKDAIEKKSEESGMKLEGFAKDEICRSHNTVYKWMSGEIPNPIDRMVKFYECTKDDRLIEHLCGVADGYFVKNFHLADGRPNINRVLSEMGDTIKNIALANEDNYIDALELLQFEALLSKVKAAGDSYIKGRREELLRDSTKGLLGT